MEDQVLSVRTMKVLMNSDTDMEFSTGLTVLTTKDSGTSTKLKVKELFGTQKETYTVASSRMTWLTDMESILTSTDLNTKENLKTTFKKVTVKRNGLTEPSTSAPTQTE